MIHITDFIEQAHLNIILGTTDNWNAKEMTLRYIENDPYSERYHQASAALMFYMIEITGSDE
ncbi:hypothetical protein [Vibrio breoganii]|uniref:hypothetical protein n=1 Tax=Vibrio breoganii TaxID=553239 RepID=UPI000C83ED63|nr:hypothetical protein [Vibrio breoganii]PMG98926.1 hypothetical protein BCU80_03220 [Vibrio breoganii]PMK34086.1 hypothetical protein BCU06_00385 [Vibrio breoganii]PML54569.1 hypothetical protein BCT73_15470 [Vibrio breoganii]PMO81351.1 hypothetical protein BCT00_11680 [Vibrio breoganii]